MNVKKNDEKKNADFQGHVKQNELTGLHALFFDVTKLVSY